VGDGFHTAEVLTRATTRSISARRLVPPPSQVLSTETTSTRSVEAWIDRPRRKQASHKKGGDAIGEAHLHRQTVASAASHAPPSRRGRSAEDIGAEA
jgi:hypothetical protein